MKRSIVAGALALALLGSLARPAAADLAVGVSPSKYELRTAAGKTATIPIMVRNSSAAPMHIVVTLSDFALTPAGEYQFAPVGTWTTSVGKAISVNPREFDLAADSFQQVRFTVDVPADAAGEYGMLVFFSNRPPRGGGLAVVQKIASKIYVVVDTVKLDGAVTGVRAAAAADGEHYHIDFHNLGNAHVALKGTLEVKSGETSVDKIALPAALTVERGGKRTIDLAGKTLAPGTYAVTATIDYGGAHLVAGQSTITVK